MNNDNSIQLDLPDYSFEYLKWLEQQQYLKEDEETVVVIDIY